MKDSRFISHLLRSMHYLSRFAKTAGLAVVFTLAAKGPALASAYRGPPPALTPGADQFQQQIIGYNGPADTIGAAKNIGEEYRRNTPNMFYACDANFLQYFGSNGLAAIDGAFGIFNSLFLGTNTVDNFSADLSEFPTIALQRNYLAQNATLYDLKSETVWVICEQLGFGESERSTWLLHDRYLLPNTACPFGEQYVLMQRNFDATLGLPPTTPLPSSYVNGALYTYEIVENCGPPPGVFWAAITDNFPVDPDARQFTSVMGAFSPYPWNTVVPYGAFFTELTRDDVGTLRWLLSSNTIRFESTGTNTTVQVPSTTPQLLFTSNLTLLAQQAFTNSPLALEALFPGLIVSGSTSNWVNILTTNVTITFTNSPFMPASFPPTVPVYHTNITLNVMPWYHHTFANVEAIVFTNGSWEAVPVTDITLFSNYTAALMQTQTLALVSPPDAPEDLFELVTNTTQRTVALSQVSGEYFILPTNLCGASSLQLQASFISTYTNILGSGTNTAAGNGTTTPTVTNIVGNTIPLSINAYQIVTYTNYAFVYLPINCVQDNTGLYQGVQSLHFYRVEYDSLVGRLFNPITNQYVMREVTNGTIMPQIVQRVITEPDFVMSAADLVSGPSTAPPFETMLTRSINWNVNNLGAGLAGPGTIDPPAPPNVITFNKVGRQYLNGSVLSTNAFLNQSGQSNYWAWGSFDGTTNSPIVYPDANSLVNLTTLSLVQTTPVYLPAGSVGNSYTAQFLTQSATPAWTAPFTYSIASGAPGGLPPGLTLSNSGQITGTPTQSGQFNFVVQITDSRGGNIDSSYYITVN